MKRTTNRLTAFAVGLTVALSSALLAQAPETRRENFTPRAAGTTGQLQYNSLGNLAAIPSGTSGQVLTSNGVGTAPSFQAAGGGGGGAPTDATYITQTANASLSAEQAMGALATGIVKNTTTTGVQSIAVLGTDYGDVVGQASAVDSEVALFSGTGGKTIKRATGSGLALLTSGVLSAANLTGDVTTSAAAATIATGAVTDAKASLAVKPAVTVVATTNQTLSGTPTVDSVATADGSVILNTAQSAGAENGPWVAHAGAWTRPTWYPAGGTTQAFQFITTFSRLGTVYGGSTWRITSSGAVTIDTTATTWAVAPHALNATTTTGLPVGANPSASLGLSAVNGSAGTFMRSDGAPALDVSIAPTWTGIHTFSAAEPRTKWSESDQAADEKLYDFDCQTKVCAFRTRTDADGAGTNILAWTRGTGTAITDVSFGNATNNPSYTFSGSGNITANGISFATSGTAMNNGLYSNAASSIAIRNGGATTVTLTQVSAAWGSGVLTTFGNTVTAPRYEVNNTTVPAVGIYRPGTNRFGFATNTTYRGEFDASGQLIIGTVGAGLSVKEGSNAKMGTCTLVGGTCTVSTTAVTANSRIFINGQSLGTVAVPSAYGVSARTAGTSFVILASAPTDTSVVAWLIVEPSP